MIYKHKCNIDSVFRVVKKKTVKKRRKKTSAVKKGANTPVSVLGIKTPITKKTKNQIEEFAVHEEEEFAKALALATKEIDEFLNSNEELKKLKKEIREKPLAYTALALTVGLALGGLIRGRD